ncbi:MAG: TetR/AcrR family transcriptional regulator [Verrucomicrobiales bacterium]|nr:TetR/AcrR family transcriptional regulator [Verrucomicrobiales bacterium]
MGKPNARERILEAAGKLFHQHGYSNVGINEIIKTADTAKASFYQHFSSKEALCEAWLESIHAKSEGWRLDILENEVSPLSKLNRYFDDLIAYFIASEMRGCPYTNTCAMVESEGVMKLIKGHKIALRDFFKTIVEEEYGPSDKVTELANQIFLVYSGAATEAQNIQDLWPIESARKAAVTLFQAYENQG